MLFRTAVSTAGDLETASREAIGAAMLDFAADAVDVDACFVFASPRYGDLDELPELLAELTAARHVIGCSGGGIVGGGFEVEDQCALSVTLASFPDVELALRHLAAEDLPGPDAPPAEWVALFGVAREDVRGFIVIPEPFSFPADRLLEGLDYAYPEAPKVGGIASGGDQPGRNALFHDRHCHDAGALVLALSGAIEVDTVVAQGCRPFGSVGKITKCESHYLAAVEGKPALEYLQDQVETLEGEDLELARTSPIFLGVAMDPFQLETPGHGDFLIRNVMGYDRQTGMMAIGHLLSAGRNVQFHLRDARTSSEDLHSVLQAQRARPEPAGALLFSCLGRGAHLYGEAGHDSRVFRELIGDTPLGGFFCNGEIGPIGATTYLHGYTSAFGLFRATRAEGSS